MRNAPGGIAPTTLSLFGLAPGGVCPATCVATSAVRSYFKLPAFAFGRTISPLPSCEGGIFSVALSLRSPSAGVTRHRIPWSPDFPRTLLPAVIRLSGESEGTEFRVQSPECFNALIYNYFYIFHAIVIMNKCPIMYNGGKSTQGAKDGYFRHRKSGNRKT